MFFSLSEEKEKLVWEIAENLEGMPECTDAREALEIVQQELESLELSFTQKIAREFALLQEGMPKLIRDLAEALYDAHFKPLAKDLFELCERLNVYARNVECLRNPESRASFLKEFEKLLELILIYCSDLLSFKIDVCEKIKKYYYYHSDLEYKTLLRGLSFHRKLIGAKRVIESIKNCGEDYAVLRRLAAAYSFYQRKVITRYSIRSPIEIFNIVASESKVSGILRYLKEKINMKCIDLLEAFRHLKILEETLKERLNIKENLETLVESSSSEKQLYGTLPALAYMLVHVSGLTDLRELLEALLNYVEDALANINRVSNASIWEEKLRAAFYDLVKILALVLCIGDHMDWRHAITFAISAAKYWSRWNEESSFIALCDAVRMMFNFVTREEAVRILTYAALYGDYDFIVKLKPFLWAYGSLNAINPHR